MVTGSEWNAQALRKVLPNVETILQGVDPSIFNDSHLEAKREGGAAGPEGPSWLEEKVAGRFVVFSGGKLELRKGQDIVISAFRDFSRTHTEALLVTAWYSGWPKVIRSINRSDVQHVTFSTVTLCVGCLVVLQCRHYPNIHHTARQLYS